MTKAEMSKLLEDCMYEAYQTNADRLDKAIKEATPKGQSAVSAEVALGAAKIAAFGTITALSKVGVLKFDD